MPLETLLVLVLFVALLPRALHHLVAVHDELGFTLGRGRRGHLLLLCPRRGIITVRTGSFPLFRLVCVRLFLPLGPVLGGAGGGGEVELFLRRNLCGCLLVFVPLAALALALLAAQVLPGLRLKGSAGGSTSLPAPLASRLRGVCKPEKNV